MTADIYKTLVENHEGDAAAALLDFANFLKDNKSFPEAEEAAAYLAQYVKQQDAGAADAFVEMPVTVTPGAQRAFGAWLKASAEKVDDEPEETAIPVGKQCVRNGCKSTYEGPESLERECVHHPGAAVFHETYKYWSCCDKTRKYDFEEFRAIPGCRAGPEKCAFSEKAAGIAKKAPCRHDFFQVGNTVTVNLYAKKVDPTKSKFFISATQMRLTLYFDGKEFNLGYNLSGNVIPSECKVEIKEPKVEVTLRKGAEGGVQGAAWEVLGTKIEE